MNIIVTPTSIITPTAIELMFSLEFWAKRYDEQVRYEILYSTSTHTRPDYINVLNSAIIIRDRCAAEWSLLQNNQV